MPVVEFSGAQRLTKQRLMPGWERYNFFYISGLRWT